MISRRSALKTAAWSVPVISVVKETKAYATSNPSEPCGEPVGWRNPGHSNKQDKDYYLKFIDCTIQPKCVYIYDAKKKIWHRAKLIGVDVWVVKGMSDSRLKRHVKFTQNEFSEYVEREIAFPVAK